MLAHIGWPTVALAVVYLIGRAIKKPDEWRRLMGTIVVLVAVVLGAMVICVQVLGMQLPGFNVPALTRTPTPAATASPQPSAPIMVSPVATASPSPSGVYPGEGGRGAGSVQRGGRAATPRATRTPRDRSGFTGRTCARWTESWWTGTSRLPVGRAVAAVSGCRFVTIRPWQRAFIIWGRSWVAGRL